MTIRLDFSIGPVQGFVSQSRRTRDLWGSSYLLAFLSAHAMRGTVEAGGRIVVPSVEEDTLYQWVRGCRDGKPPRVGSLPNHFVVELEGNAAEVAQAGIRSLRNAWERVCRAVWSKYVESACPIGNGTEDIWNRQVGSFWEIMWTASDADVVGGLLARRKRWRTHQPAEEPGDKCTVMPTLQELSGFVRAQDRLDQDKFWGQVRHGGLSLLDLRENERLSAIALVKRMLPNVAEEALGWDVEASQWPSTVCVGAVPWMRRVMSASPQQAANYARAVSQNTRENVLPMQEPPFTLEGGGTGAFSKLDANYLHLEFVRDPQRCPSPTSTAARISLAERLRVLYEAEDEQGQPLGPPPAFYALLLADGDRLGKLVADSGGQCVSEALAKFTQRVPALVHDQDGVVVYAGGDDVLAMVPIQGALACAQDLSSAYRNAFSGTGGERTATISAAIVFAHVRSPLKPVIDEAHHLLDSVAKDRNGRNSLAVTVLKPSGPYCKWVTTWTRPGPDGDVDAVDLLESLVEQIEANSKSSASGLSSALVYRIRDILARLCGWDQWEPGSWGDVPDEVDLRPFLRSEISHSLQVRMDNGEGSRAEELTTSVCGLLEPARQPDDRQRGTAIESGGNARVSQVGVDALLLARFLANPEE